MTQQDILLEIQPITTRYTVPLDIVTAIITVESNFNPRALGDNGTSYGLFQLHIGGQADRAIADGHTPEDLFDPVLNAKYGMPSIASAWNTLHTTFDANSFTWWLDFCAQSGHPGGSRTNSATIALASTLQRTYQHISTGVINHAPTKGTNMTNLHGEVADFPAVSQFEGGESAYECVAFAVSTCHYAGQVGKGPTGTPEAVDKLADHWYNKLTGSFDSGNQSGMSVQQELTMLIGLGNHYQVLPVDPNSPHNRDIENVKGALKLGYPVIICGAETGMVDIALGDHVPYSWTPFGNHCIVASGIAHDGNLLVRDNANVDGHGVRPGPRTYDVRFMDLISAVVFVPSWLPRPDSATDFTKAEAPQASLPIAPPPIVVPPTPIVPLPQPPVVVPPTPVLPVVPTQTATQAELLATIAMLRDGIDHLLAEISKLWQKEDTHV